jgi:hypothetical protein
MKKFARRVGLGIATVTIAMGLVAVAPAPGNAMESSWGCPGCKSNVGRHH